MAAERKLCKLSYNTASMNRKCKQIIWVKDIYKLENIELITFIMGQPAKIEDDVDQIQEKHVFHTNP